MKSAKVLYSVSALLRSNWYWIAGVFLTIHSIKLPYFLDPLPSISILSSLLSQRFVLRSMQSMKTSIGRLVGIITGIAIAFFGLVRLAFATILRFNFGPDSGLDYNEVWFGVGIIVFGALLIWLVDKQVK